MKPAKDKYTGIRLYHDCGRALMTSNQPKYYLCPRCDEQGKDPYVYEGSNTVCLGRPSKGVAGE